MDCNFPAPEAAATEFGGGGLFMMVGGLGWGLGARVAETARRSLGTVQDPDRVL